MTFFFCRISNAQTVRFKMVAIQRCVIDPAAYSRITNNPFVADGDVSAIPNAVLATETNHINIEEIGRAIELDRLHASAPVPVAAKLRALAQVDASLQKQE